MSYQSMAAKVNTWPLVSVLVPAYNHDQYIGRCLNSVLEESYPNKELLIINDGSTDNTHGLICEWIERHGKLVKTDYLRRKNCGIAYTLNELISRARGEYIVPLASDDYLLSGGIAERVRYLQIHNEKLAAFGDCIVVGSDDAVLFDSGLTGLHSAKREQYFSDEGLMREIIWNWSVPGPVFLAKRDIYDVVGRYDVSLRAEDWDYYLRTVSRNLLGYVDHKVSAYRVHDQSSCRTAKMETVMHKELLRTAIKNLRNFKGYARWLLVKKALVYVFLILESSYPLRFKK